VAKKSASRKSTVKKKGKKKTTTRKRLLGSTRRDASQLDLHPLIEHIQNLIEKLEKKRGAAPAPAPAPGARALDEGTGGGDTTVDRLKHAKQLFEDICHPDMAIPI
jgi:hypothetical protein